MTAIISKVYCSPSQASFIVRRRPPVFSGGGIVVMNCNQKVVFRVDGCDSLGVKGELRLKDGDGESLLIIRRKGGIVQALSINRRWKGYRFDYQGEEKLVFSVSEPVSFIVKNNPVKIMIEPRHHKGWDFEVKGSFPDRACVILNSRGDIAAKICRKDGLGPTSTQDLYQVVVEPGIDQAFVFGVIAILDNIHGEATRCNC